MAAESARDEEVASSERLVLREMLPSDASLLRELWESRDARTPPHRRISPDGHPTVAELEASIRDSGDDRRLFVVELRSTDEPVGYCGLVAGNQDGEGPELAYELLPRHRGRGYATEAARAVVGLAAAEGHDRLWATVWEWNAASRHVLAKLGFTEMRRESTPQGVNLTTRLDGLRQD